jgi:glycosyltransferase involved in cell wall biosynthesis
MKVALVGPYPPPYGGISVAIQRLRALLEAQGVACAVYDTSNVPKQVPGVIPIHRWQYWILRYWLTTDVDILHYQSSSWKLRAAVGILPWRAKTVVSIQGNSLVDSWTQGGYLRRALIRAALRRTSYIILSNPDYVQLVEALGIHRERIAVVPAFIPPVVDERDDRQISADIWAFCRAHTPLLLSNGTVAFYRGQDLYGLDLLIELVRLLSADYPQVGLVCPLRPITGHVEQAYWADLQRRVAAYGLSEHFCWIAEGVPVLYPLMRHSDLFVRPTNTDGDAVSIREALYFGVPTLASDVSPRPQGTVLFRNRDLDDLILQTKRVLSGKYRSSLGVSDSSFDEIWRIYQQLIGG